MSNIQIQRRSEKGNVLFLILIAVALFAALSYVVTQSTRSGGGSTEREKNILSSAQMTQYPTALRTSIIRMVLAGVAIENVMFDAPGDPGFTGQSNSALLVFHPQGGGATYQDAPSELSASGSGQLSWRYNGSVEVPGIGIDDEGGNDVIAFLPGISDGVCRQVNEELGIDPEGSHPIACGDNIPQVTGIDDAVDAMMDVNQVSFPDGSASVRLEPANCTELFNRQASGCFRDVDDSRNVFYSVLLER
jgi:hypothetical protein